MRRKKNVVTINDIAKMANVSKSTVSHVINGTKYVSEKTRKKVEKVIEETGYILNFNAKSLKKLETKTIGVVISDIKNKFFIDVIHAIDEEARNRGFKVILANSDESEDRQTEIVNAMYERRVDGLIFSPTVHTIERTIPFLKKVQLPTVLIDRKIEDGFDWVGIENVQATKLLVQHLIQLGHKRISLVAGVKGINTTEERITGYTEALKEAGLPLEESFIIIGESRSMPAEEKVREMIEGTPDCPTAIIAANNLMVLGTMRALKKMNVSIPEDIALVSFDDFEGADLFHPGLTAIAQPCAKIGSKAVNLLLERIKNPNKEQEDVCLNPKLIIRDSCGYNK